MLYVILLSVVIPNLHAEQVPVFKISHFWPIVIWHIGAWSNVVACAKQRGGRKGVFCVFNDLEICYGRIREMQQLN